MSDEQTKLPAVTVASPIPVFTTAAVERANHLLSLRNHPGFLDIIQISLDLVKESTDLAMNTTAWDPLQITVLKSQAHGSRTHHEMLFQRISESIAVGIMEQKELLSANPNAHAQVAEDHDYVRQKAMELGAEIENRAAGSYGPGE